VGEGSCASIRFNNPAGCRRNVAFHPSAGFYLPECCRLTRDQAPVHFVFRNEESEWKRASLYPRALAMEQEKARRLSMNRISHSARLLCAALFLLGTATIARSRAEAQGAFNVLTRNYNSQRTGANLSEKILNTSNVNSRDFGKLFALPVDDQIYAGILYVSDVPIAGGIHNVIYVATANNSVYAFDADVLAEPLWLRNFNGGGRPTVNSEVRTPCDPYRDFIGNIGIVGTPVIDRLSKALYFVARTVENSETVQRLHAIDITTGDERPNSPRVIQASVPGIGAGAQNGQVRFDPRTALQRPALTLSGDGIVYVGWAALCDMGPYHGWMIAYDSRSLEQVGAFNSSPDGDGAGIWMSGAGPSLDGDGCIYFSTGNGSWNGANMFGESVVKVAPRSLSPLDYFTPYDWQTLNTSDNDYGTQSQTMLPGTRLLVTGDKEGRLFLLDMCDLGRMEPRQSFQAVSPAIQSNSHQLHNSTPAWVRPGGVNLYIWGENDYLRGFRFNPTSRLIDTTPFAVGAVLPQSTGGAARPGGILLVSASGSKHGTGIVWATIQRVGDANQNTVPGDLYAFNAETLGRPLWSSKGPGDDILNFAKGSPPLIANGKVYVATISNFVSVFGLKSAKHVAQNLARNLPRSAYTGSPATGEKCDRGDTPDKAFDGISESSRISPATKWCSEAAQPFLQVDLGANFNVNRFVLEHASAGGEPFSSNTRDFDIQLSTDGASWDRVVTVVGNSYSITTHDIAPQSARFVRLNISLPTQTGVRPARIYELQVFGLLPSAKDFHLSSSPRSQTLTAGNEINYTTTVSPLNGFSGAVSLSVSGLPPGVSARFDPPSVTAPGNSTLHVFTTGSAEPGSFPLIVKGIAGGATRNSSIVLNVNLNGSGSISLNKIATSQAAYNASALFADGHGFAGGLNGTAYRASELGSTQVVGELRFKLGRADSLNAWTNTTVPLPAVRGNCLGLLAAAIGESVADATFIVKYTDGTTGSIRQGISDWEQPPRFGETAISTNQRNRSNGATGQGTFRVFAYSLPTDPAKTLESITLPHARIVVLGLTAGNQPVDSPASYNVIAITSDGRRFVGGLDGGGFSANQLGSTQTVFGVPFDLGPANALDAWTNTTVPLPTGRFDTLALIAASPNGNQRYAHFAVKYTDGTIQYFVRHVSDWDTQQDFPGETKLVMDYRNNGKGKSTIGHPFKAYAYFFRLDANKVVKSVSLGNPSVVVLAMTLVPRDRSATPDVALSASPRSLSLTAGSSATTTIAVAPVNGFNRRVPLSVSPLPSGVTAVFKLVDATGTSTLTLSADNSARAGTFTATVTGEAIGGAKRSTNISLVVRPDASSPVPVDLSSAYLWLGAASAGAQFDVRGGLGVGHFAYPAEQLGSSLIFDDVRFSFGPPDAPNAVPGVNQALDVPAGKFSFVKMLAIAVNGRQRSQILKANYDDGSSAYFKQSFSDWAFASAFPGESRALTVDHRSRYDTTRDDRSFYLNGYSFALDSSKTVTSISLPGNSNVSVFAIALVP
jgi:hypothetical protein